MAALFTHQEIILKTFTLCSFILLLISTKTCGVEIRKFAHGEVSLVLDDACFLAGIHPVDSGLLEVLGQLASIYQDDPHVVNVGIISQDEIGGLNHPRLRVKSPLGPVKSINEVNEKLELLLFHRRVKDRTCLIQPAHIRSQPVGELVRAPWSVPALLSRINEHCNGFRDINGQYTAAGLHRNEILNNLFYVKTVSNVTMGKAVERLVTTNHTDLFHAFNSLMTTSKQVQFSSSKMQEVCGQYGDFTASDGCEMCTEKPLRNYANPNRYKSTESKKTPEEIATCDVLNEPPSQDQFFHEYLKRSRPFIIRNFTNSWPAFEKWTNTFLRSEFGPDDVHVKLTPSGDYEGVERADLWEDFDNFDIPEEVKRQLKFPDLVTVRPAGVNMNFSKFMDLLEKAAREGEDERTLSAYLEYSSIPDYMPDLVKDIIEPGFIKNLLKRSHLNIWLSDGHTLGRLHFDQYDNILCQISGTKQLTLFEPHDNRRLYEAHIPQATLSFNPETHTFRRRKLEDSTSMVMAPIDLKHPDFKRFPLFADTYPLLCTIHEGDALFLPSFWWHEVQSSPSETHPRNLAVNFWYEPFLKRAFPCQECTLDINPDYQHLLTSKTL